MIFSQCMWRKCLYLGSVFLLLLSPSFIWKGRFPCAKLSSNLHKCSWTDVFLILIYVFHTLQLSLLVYVFLLNIIYVRWNVMWCFLVMITLNLKTFSGRQRRIIDSWGANKTFKTDHFSKIVATITRQRTYNDSS